jgi:hypothetical protein
MLILFVQFLGDKVLKWILKENMDISDFINVLNGTIYLYTILFRLSSLTELYLSN